MSKLYEFLFILDVYFFLGIFIHDICSLKRKLLNLVKKTSVKKEKTRSRIQTSIHFCKFIVKNTVIVYDIKYMPCYILGDES